MNLKLCIIVTVNIILTANAAKGEQSSEESSNEESTTTEADSSINECDGKKYWDSGLKDYKVLHLFTFSEFNFDQTLDQICKSSKESIESLASNGHCMQPNQKQFFNLFIDTYRAVYDSRCSNETSWYADFVEFSKCLKSETIAANMDKCVDKASAIVVYIEKNIPKEDQAKIMCCNAQAYSSCVAETTKVCGKDAAEFAVQTLMGPPVEPFAFLCKGLTPDFCAKYPKAIAEAKKIFESDDNPPYDNVYKYLMLLAKNSLDG